MEKIRLTFLLFQELTVIFTCIGANGLTKRNLISADQDISVLNSNFTDYFQLADRDISGQSNMLGWNEIENIQVKTQTNETESFLQTNSLEWLENSPKLLRKNRQSSRKYERASPNKNRKKKQINSTKHFRPLTRDPIHVKKLKNGRRIIIKPTFRQGKSVFVRRNVADGS